MSHLLRCLFLLILITCFVPVLAADVATSVKGSSTIRIDTKEAKNILLNTNDSVASSRIGVIKESEIQSSHMKINVGRVNNIIDGASNSSSRINLGTVSNVQSGDINIQVDTKDIENKISGGNNNHAITNIGALKNTRIRGGATIEVKAGSIQNRIKGGQNNQAEISIGYDPEDDTPNNAYSGDQYGSYPPFDTQRDPFARPGLKDGVNVAGRFKIFEKLGTLFKGKKTGKIPKTVPKKYSGNLVKVGKPDPHADALAKKLKGDSRVRFENDPSLREFDAVSKKYIAQAKPASVTKNKKFRDQAKATFEAAKDTDRKVYYHFQGKPAQEIIDKLKEYSKRYNVKLKIDTKPLTF